MIEINVDLKNPAQMLATGGLLELLAERHPDVEGCFAKILGDEGVFLVQGIESSDVETFVGDLLLAAVREEKDRGLLLSLSGRERLLDWYLPLLERRSLKTWTGQVTPLKLVGDFLATWRAAGTTIDANLFTAGGPDCGKDGVSRTRFDPRSTISKDSVGFSANDVSLRMWIYHATELLAFIGMQTFRPKLTRSSQDCDTLAYSVWETPLPIELARYVFQGGVRECSTRSYAFNYLREIKDQGWFNFSYAWPL